MKIAILGTGPVGKSLAGKFSELGHAVTVGTRDPETTLARQDADMLGNPPFLTWLEEHSAVRLSDLATAATDADVIINATSGGGAVPALEAVGEENLAGKVVLDISNPIDASGGMPPSLFVSNTDSLGEQIQRRFPRVRVVKTLNTMNATVMVDPRQLAAGDHSTFVSGNDAEAKKLATELLTQLGHTDVIDLGDITTARGTEMYLALWLRLWGSLGTPMFNIKVVR